MPGRQTDLYLGDETLVEGGNNIRACTLGQQEINAIGFRTRDRLLYGVVLKNRDQHGENGNSGIVRIGRGCATEGPYPVRDPNLGRVVQRRRFALGAISPDGNQMFLSVNAESLVCTVELNQFDRPTVGSLVAHCEEIRGADGKVNDWAYNPDDQRLYGGDSNHNQLAVVNPANGERSDYEVNSESCDFSAISGGGFGGARFDADGHLVLHRGPRQYIIDVETRTCLGQRSDFRPSSRFDAAACRLPCGSFHDEAYFMQDRSDGARLFRTNRSAVAYSAEQICGRGSTPWFTNDDLTVPFNIELNNMCVRSTNGMLYALKLTDSGVDQLVRINPVTCEIAHLGLPTDLPNDDRFDSGDCTADGQTMFVSPGGLLHKFYAIDLSTLQAQKMTMTKFGQIGTVHDWAFRDGALFGADDDEGKLGTVAVTQDLDGHWSGERRNHSLPGLPAHKAFGSAWTTAGGNLVVIRNADTEASRDSVYEVDTQSQRILRKRELDPDDPNSGVRSSVFNEGASCAWFDR